MPTPKKPRSSRSVLESGLVPRDQKKWLEKILRGEHPTPNEFRAVKFVNGRIVDVAADADWPQIAREQSIQLPFGGLLSQELDDIMDRYIKARAEFIHGVEAADLVKLANAAKFAALALLGKIDGSPCRADSIPSKAGLVPPMYRAYAYLREEVVSAEGGGFDWDAFYPMLTALCRRLHLVADKEPQILSTERHIFRSWIVDLMDWWTRATSQPVTASVDTAELMNQSPFVLLTEALMARVPPQLQQFKRASNLAAQINSVRRWMRRGSA